jgi:two-component system sensor histidine kinase YesM
MLLKAMRRIANLLTRRHSIGTRFAINAVVMLIAVYLAATVISYVLVGEGVRSHAERNTEILRALNDVLRLKSEQFLQTVFELYEQPEYYETLSTFLELPAESPDLSRASFRQEVNRVLRQLANRDSDIEAILIYKAGTGETFVYDALYQTFDLAPPGFPFLQGLERDTQGRSIHGMEEWAAGAHRQFSAFGIAATIGSRSLRLNAGRLLVAYDSDVFADTVKRYLDDSNSTGRFLLGSDVGEFAFDSGRSADATATGQRLTQERLSEASRSGETIQISGEPNAVVAIDLAESHITGFYVEPERITREIARRAILAVFGMSTAFAMLAVILYIRASALISRRVHRIDEAMQRIGAHDLSHRIPVEPDDDELTHIAVSFNHMCDLLEESIDRLYKNEIKKRSAELDALQSSINPHFLYNSLQAACATARRNDDEDTANFLTLLSTLLRGILRSGTVVPIRKEVEFCRVYVEVFRYRYGESFECQFEIDSSVARLGVPKNMLQPIVENYFVHGIRPDDDQNYLGIRVRDCGATVQFEIEDDGRGINPVKRDDLNRGLRTAGGEVDGMGLSNVSRRLRLVYGEAFSMSIHERKPRGTVIRLSIPKNSVQDLLLSLDGTEHDSAHEVLLSDRIHEEDRQNDDHGNGQSY